MGVVRFLLLSDLHLGRPFGWLPRERRAERRSDLRRAVGAAVRHALERGADAILVPGDVFDSECVDADTLAYAVHDLFGAPGCPPVYIAPGNHDPCSDTSHYWNPELLRARGWAWPAHVHVFTTAAWAWKPLPGHENVRVWGRCYMGGVISAERPLDPAALAAVPAAPAGGANVAVFHGSREGFCPPGQKLTAPFSDAEALASPFDLMAAGHYHAHSVLEDGGSARLVYAGAPIALDVTESGAPGACEVRLTLGEGRPRAEAGFLELDRRRVHDLRADLAGAASAEQVDGRIARALEQAGVNERDIVTVRLAGRLTRGVRWESPGPELRARAFHLRVDRSALRPDYDLEALRASTGGTTEERFARALLEQLGREADPAVRAEIEAALYYGLDAFRLREVVPAYEELES